MGAFQRSPASPDSTVLNLELKRIRRGVSLVYLAAALKVRFIETDTSFLFFWQAWRSAQVLEPMYIVYLNVPEAKLPIASFTFTSIRQYAKHVSIQNVQRNCVQFQ